MLGARVPFLREQLMLQFIVLFLLLFIIILFSGVGITRKISKPSATGYLHKPWYYNVDRKRAEEMVRNGKERVLCLVFTLVSTRK